MFEALRDETYGRRNRVVAAVLAVITIAAGGLLWVFWGTLLPTLAVAIVFGALAWVWFVFFFLGPVQFALFGDEVWRESRRRRR